MAMTVLVLDFSVLAMNHQFSLLVLGDLPCTIDRVLFTVEMFGVLFGSGTPDCPLVVPRNDMLIAICHFLLHMRGGMPLLGCAVIFRNADKAAQLSACWHTHRTYNNEKGGSVQQSSPTDEYATAEEFAAAVAQLTTSELIRLKKRAAILLWGSEYSNPMELLNEAVKRTLIAATGDRKDGERGRPWPKNRVVLPAFLSMCMQSIADSSQDSIAQTMTDGLEAMADSRGETGTVLHGAGFSHPDIVEQALVSEEDAERQAAAKQDVAIIQRHFAADQAVLAVIEGEKEELSVAEVLEMFEIDQKTYDSARRRLRRQVDKLMPGRRLK